MSKTTQKLLTRQWRLKDLLTQRFESGKFITIEEICEALPEYYELNTNPYNHDKCVKLSNDVRDINWNVNEGYKIIVKDSKGNIKLCESVEEFEAWRLKELAPLERKWKYLNQLVYKAKRDDTAPLLNQALNPTFDNVKENDLKVVEVYAK